jgi:hypothetical protein
MATVKITTEGDKTAFATGVSVVLTAETDAHAEAFQWRRDGANLAGETRSQYQFPMAADAAATYSVVAIFGQQPVTSAPVAITLAPTASPGTVTEPATTPPPEQPPVFHPIFAIGMGIVGVGLAFGIVVGLNLLNGRAGFLPADWSTLEGRLKVGLVMALPLTALGGLAVLTGLWMALVEWRGRFAERKAEPESAVVRKGLGGEDAGKIIDAVGKLRGAALAMVVGAILLVAAAWVAQSAAGTAAEPTPSASSAPASRAP